MAGEAFAVQYPDFPPGDFDETLAHELAQDTGEMLVRQVEARGDDALVRAERHALAARPSFAIGAAQKIIGNALGSGSEHVMLEFTHPLIQPVAQRRDEPAREAWVEIRLAEERFFRHMKDDAVDERLGSGEMRPAGKKRRLSERHSRQREFDHHRVPPARMQ
jgi:hypothetical protein